MKTIGTLVRTEGGAVLQKMGHNCWRRLMIDFESGTIEDEVAKFHGEIIWEPDVLDGLLAGSIIQDASCNTVVAVKTPMDKWLIVAEPKSGYSDDEVRVYFMGGIEVVKEVR